MLSTLLIGYGVVLLLVTGCQRRLIYIPTKLSLTAAHELAAQSGFQPWRDGAGEAIGWRMPALGEPRASVLIFHGNAGCAAQRDYLVHPLRQIGGVEVFVLEYPGYGARNGSPSRKSIVRAAEEAFAHLPPERPRYLVSESLGVGAATHVARQHPADVAGILMFAPFHNLASVAQQKMFLFPAYFMLLDRFHPAADLRDYRGPVKIVLAGADEVIPASSGRKLFAGYAGPKDLQIIEHARHNDIPAQPPEWWAEVFAFWERTKADGR